MASHKDLKIQQTEDQRRAFPDRATIGTDLKDFSERLEGYRWVLTLVKEKQYRAQGLSEGLDVGHRQVQQSS